MLTTKPNGHGTSYVYDEIGKLLAVDDSEGGAGGVTRYAYDANRNKVAQQDASGNLTTYGYDALNRLTDLYQHRARGTLAADTLRGADPGGDMATALHRRFGYNPNGNQNLMVDARGQRVTSSYDHLDRLATREYSEPAPGFDGQPVYPQPLRHSYAYDLNGNLVQVDEEKITGPGQRVTAQTVQTFDSLKRLRTRTNRDGRTAAYRYDPQGNRLSVSDADGVTTQYRYDGRERLIELVAATAAGPSRTVYSYYPDGLSARVEYPNGTVAERTYDRAGRLTGILNHGGDPGDPISRYAYGYDADGNRVFQEEQHRALDGSNERTDYAYDALDRLTRVTYADGATVAYSYAANGNRLTETGTDPKTRAALDRRYSYDNLNRLLTVEERADPAASIAYGYDDNGNTVTRNVGSLDPGTGTVAGTAGLQVFDYDQRDKLTAAAAGGVRIASFDYDYTGMRTRKAGAGHATAYLYDQRSVLQEYDPATLATTRKYNYDGVSLQSLLTGGRIHFYLLDGLRSTSEITDDAGAVVDSYAYDAWGGMRRELSLLANDRKFTGHYYDEETGLHYFGARYYDDATGRFWTQDPNLGDMTNPPSLHRYTYAHGNPTTFVDLEGLAAVTNKSVLGLDDASVEASLAQDPSTANVVKLAAKQTLYDIWNLATGGFVARQDAREEKLQTGQITEREYWLGTGIDAGASIAAQAAGGGAAKFAAGGAVGFKAAVLGGAGAGLFSSAAIQTGEVATNRFVSENLGRRSYDVGGLLEGAAMGAAFGGAIHVAASAGSIASEITTLRTAVRAPEGMPMAPLQQVARQANVSEVGAVLKQLGRRLDWMSRMEGGTFSWQRAVQFERALAEVPGNKTFTGAKYLEKGGTAFHPMELAEAHVISKTRAYAEIFANRGQNLTKNLFTTRASVPELLQGGGGRYLKGDIDVISDAPELQGNNRAFQDLRYDIARRANRAAGVELLDVYSPDHGVLPIETPTQIVGENGVAHDFFIEGSLRNKHVNVTTQLFKYGARIGKLKKVVVGRDPVNDDFHWVGARELISFP